jgi:PKD repeat protein
MIKTTKIYIVVFLCLILARTPVFAQYTGGSADGAHTDMLSLTGCTTPPHFYAYFGGTGDGAHTDLVTYTACGTPSQFFAFMGGTADGAATDLLTLTACATPPSQFFAYMGGTADGAVTDLLTLTACSTPPSQFFAYMGGNADGAVTDLLTLTACTTTPSQFYAYMGGSGDGFSKDNINFCPNAKPVVDFSGTPLTICAGDSVQFTDLSTNSPFIWKWTFTGGAVATSTISNPKIRYNTAGTYAVKLIAQNGIGSDSLTKTAYITVNAIPLANAGPDIAICNGASTTFSASGGTSYSWIPATALSSTTSANPVANPTLTTTYTVNVTSSGCSKTAVITVTVIPTPTANAGPNVAICNGSSTTLGASGGTSYTWTPAVGLSSTTIANPVASPTATTIYTVTVSNGVCSSTSVVTVTVNSLPIANAGTNTVICNGTSATLAASGGTSYSWLPATGLSSSTIANPISSPTTTTNYTVTVSNGTCSANSLVTVSVTPLPNASAGSGVAICKGSSKTFSASGGKSYLQRV